MYYTHTHIYTYKKQNLYTCIYIYCLSLSLYIYIECPGMLGCAKHAWSQFYLSEAASTAFQVPLPSEEGALERFNDFCLQDKGRIWS